MLLEGQPAGWFNLAGWFTREWQLDADDSLPAEDVLLIGLVYMTIRHRESQQHSA